MAKVMMVASEAAPYVKTGGLADVLGSLPAALAAQGDKVSVVIPKYRGVWQDGAQRVWEFLPVSVGPHQFTAEIFHAVRDGVDYYFVGLDELYNRDGVYGYADDHIRFGALSAAALGIARNIVRPEIAHCHDWQSALVPVYLRENYRNDPQLSNVKTIYTIHNLGYQGRFGDASRICHDLGLAPNTFTISGLEYYGDVNLMKAGLVWSNWLTTVSRAYAREIQTPEYGFGLDGLLRDREVILTGILNGVDYGEWNPEHDHFLARNYSIADLSGKQACRLDLMREFGLPPSAANRPILGIVSRFANQKGFDLIAEIAASLLDENITLIVLGKGESYYEDMFANLASTNPDKISVRMVYSNAIAHKVEAGSDMFLMPSKYEPCGLNQIYSLKYGTPPIVRATGGLDDTIEEDTGFKFGDYSGAALLDCIRQALRSYKDKPAWQERMRRGMRKDFSWDVSAAEYSALYRQLLGR